MPLPQLGRGMELGADLPRSRRRVERQRADTLVPIASPSGEQTVAAIRNVSIHGCNLQTDADWLRMGRVIGIGIGPERKVQGIVRWTRDGSTGVEFLRALSSAEAQRLASSER
jgi:hypothetical protein